MPPFVPPTPSELVKVDGQTSASPPELTESDVWVEVRPRPYLPESVYEVVVQESIPAQIRLILYVSNSRVTGRSRSFPFSSASGGEGTCHTVDYAVFVGTGFWGVM